MLPKPLQSILDNPLVKAALFKQLKKVMKDNNIELITLSLDEKGEMKIEAYNVPTKVLPKQDFEIILNQLVNGNTNS
jgi:hypothetical protein